MIKIIYHLMHKSCLSEVILTAMQKRPFFVQYQKQEGLGLPDPNSLRSLAAVSVCIIIEDAVADQLTINLDRNELLIKFQLGFLRSPNLFAVSSTFTEPLRTDKSQEIGSSARRTRNRVYCMDPQFRTLHLLLLTF